MDRRDFLKGTSTLFASTALAPSILAESSETLAPSNSKGRLVLPMNRNWRYSPTYTEAAHDRYFDDSNFERVVIPHTNLRLPWHGFDEKSYEFVSVYRRHF